MNLGDYRVAVKDRMGVPAGDNTLSESRLDSAINGALKHIATTADWPWLFVEETVTVLAEASRVALPAHVTKILYVISDNGALYLRQLADVVGTLDQGVPSIYAPIGTDLFVSPAADVATELKVGAVRTEPVLVLPADSPLLPDAYSDWLISEAAVRVAISVNNAERIAHLREEAVVAKRAVIDNARRTAGLPAIRRTRPSIWPYSG